MLRELKRIIKIILGHRPFNKRKFIANLNLLNKTLARTELNGRYWMVCGLVLGYFREKDIIEHDRDADFGIAYRDHELFKNNISKLEAVGFKGSHIWTNSDGRATEYTFVKDGVKFEFFLQYESENDATYEWYVYHGTRKIELKCAIPKYNLKKVKFLGSEWLMPEDEDHYLTCLYGDWRTPRKNYDYTNKEHAPCLVELSEWRGTFNWNLKK